MAEGLNSEQIQLAVKAGFELDRPSIQRELHKVEPSCSFLSKDIFTSVRVCGTKQGLHCSFNRLSLYHKARQRTKGKGGTPELK